MSAVLARPALHVIQDEHRTLAAVLRSLRLMLRRGPADQPVQFFDVVRAMLFYVDEYPERLHHPKETELLFPRVLRERPQLAETVARLDQDHDKSHAEVRELQHQLLAWELLGEARRKPFETQCDGFIDFYLAHMKVEEDEILTAAREVLKPADWHELDKAFAANEDPLTQGMADPRFERLFSRIVLRAPAPIGVGPDGKWGG